MNVEDSREVAASPRIIHVGFGKTATTALQLAVFPRFAEQCGLEYVPMDDLRIRLHVAKLSLGKKVDKPIEASPRFIVSEEALHGWDPYFWEEWADKNRQYFGRDSHVLLTLREPKSYLTSVYLQLCLHEGNIQEPADLFLDNELYSPFLASAKFAINLFGYKRIIDIYRACFDTVTVVKYESMGDMMFLKEFAQVGEMDLLRYVESFRSEQVNRSYGQRAVNTTFALQKRLASIELSLDSSVKRNSLDQLKLLREQKEIRISSGSRGGGASGFRERSHRWRFLKWSSLMRRLEQYFSYQKYMLDFEALPQVRLGDLAEEYAALPAVATYRIGHSGGVRY